MVSIESYIPATSFTECWLAVLWRCGLRGFICCRLLKVGSDGCIVDAEGVQQCVNAFIV